MIILTIVVPIYNSEKTLIKCLNSIPKRNDIELICCDDCSEDSSWSLLTNWKDHNIHNFNNIIINKNDTNLGVGKTKRHMYDIAKGKYIITIDSDDYVITKNYSDAIDQLYKNYKDNELLVIDFRKNDNKTYVSNIATATWRYFIKSRYMYNNNLHIHETRRAEDWFMLEDAKKLVKNKQPVFKRLGILAYHYNSPREGSLEWEHNKERLYGKQTIKIKS